MFRLLTRRIFLPLAFLAAPLLFGCSRFEGDWRTPSVVRAASEGGDSLRGRWKGSWKSRANGHSGSLRCIMTPLGGDAYRAQFHATFGLVFQFDYTVKMDVRREGDGPDAVAHFTGKADLGKMAGGLYEYAGHADGRVFHSTYRSRDDHGYFKMRRPQ